MSDPKFGSWPGSFTTSQNFQGISSVCQDVTSWQTEPPRTGFEIPTVRAPVAPWKGEVQMPELFHPKKKQAAPRLTNAESGIFRQTTELNLSELAAFLVETDDFIAVGEDLAVYRKPCWHILSRQEILREISMRLDSFGGSYLSSYQLQEIKKRILNSAQVQHFASLPAADYRILCCKDSLYRWADDTITPPKRKYLRFNHLEVSANDIRPSRTPFFDHMVETAAQGDSGFEQRLLECLGVILTGYPCKRFFVFEGPPDSGKSQLARFLREILGTTSCFAVNDIEQFHTRFLTGMLPGKLLCVCSDVSDKPLTPKAVGLIKQLTGDDLIFGERKYQDANVFANTAKLLFLTNFPLQIWGARPDPAFLKRMVKIPFHHSVPEEEQIPDLYRHFMREAGGIIWKSLQSLEALIERGGAFTALSDENDMTDVEAVPTQQDLVREFVQERCKLREDARTPAEMLCKAYTQFLLDIYGISESISTSSFSKILNKLSLPIQKHHATKLRGYKGIELCPDYIID